MSDFTDPPATPATPSTAPSRTDRSTFAPRADAGWAWLFSTFWPWLISFVSWVSTFTSELAVYSSKLFNAAGVAAMAYTFKSETADADPGTGCIRLDNATQNAATVIRADLAEAGTGVDLTAMLDAMDDSTSAIKGTLRISHRDTPTTKYLVFNVTAVSAADGYRNIAATCIASTAGSPFAADDPVTVSFSRNGDDGLASDMQSQAPLAVTTAGTGSAYTATPTPAWAGYEAGKTLFATFHAASGANPTLNVSGLGATVNLVKQMPDGSYANVAAGDIPANHRSRVTLLSATQAWVEWMPKAGFTAPVIDRAYAEYTASAALSATIPADDTLPQVTEGTQIISLPFTMKSAANRLRLRFQGEGAPELAPNNLIASIFSSASPNALAAVCVVAHGASYNTQLLVEHEYVPGTTAPLTFSVRVGASGSAMRMNGAWAGRLLGGAARCTLVLEEIPA